MRTYQEIRIILRISDRRILALKYRVKRSCSRTHPYKNNPGKTATGADEALLAVRTRSRLMVVCIQGRIIFQLR